MQKIVFQVSASFFFFTSTLLIIFRGQIAIAFSDSEEVRQMFNSGLLLGAFSTFFMSIHSFITAPLHALGKKKLLAKMYMTCMLLLMIPLMATLAFWLDLGLNGIFLGQLIMNFILIIITGLVSNRIDYRAEVAT